MSGHQRKYFQFTHGTRGMYNHGCRCDECGIANRDYHRLWRKRKGIAPTPHLQAGSGMRRSKYPLS